jgi:RNA polymerase sigma-70 factor (ECF subfamily)
VQQAYLAAYRNLGQFAGEARFSTWLTRICIHEALARGRGKTRRAEVELMAMKAEPEAPIPTPEQTASRRELRALLEHAVEELDEPYRLVFVLREVQQLSTEETAESLQISEDNVKVRLHRAKAMLRETMLARLDASAVELYGFQGARCDRLVAQVMQALSTLPRPRR